MKFIFSGYATKCIVGTILVPEKKSHIDPAKHAKTEEAVNVAKEQEPILKCKAEVESGTGQRQTKDEDEKDNKQQQSLNEIEEEDYKVISETTREERVDRDTHCTQYNFGHVEGDISVQNEASTVNLWYVQYFVLCEIMINCNNVSNTNLFFF